MINKIHDLVSIFYFFYFLGLSQCIVSIYAHYNLFLLEFKLQCSHEIIPTYAVQKSSASLQVLIIIEVIYCD